VIGSRSRVAALGTAQTVAWASSFYLPAMLAAPMAREFGRPASSVFGLLSIALVLSALLSPWAGRAIDRLGGRPVLLASTGLFMAGLTLLALAPNLAVLAAGWLVLGLAMGCGLYDAAFATLVRQLGTEARRAISGITLIAGFASTVGWPLSALMETHWGWRGACMGWVALHGLVALPLYLWLLPRGMARGVAAAAAPAGANAGGQAAAPPATTRGALAMVIAVFTCWAMVSTSVATHLPSVLQAAGLSLAAAVGLAALAGPSQVVARVMELSFLGRASPLFTARLAALGHPLAAAGLLIAGPVAALPFVVLHGLGNGLLTIVRGTLPLALFGAQGYGARQGWISMPGRLLGAASPWLLGLLLERHGAAALGLTAALAGTALVLLLLLRLPHAAAHR
jgi:predicted MFS family arabinose efflux permease